MAEAEDRDLPASQRRLDKAREASPAPMSREVGTLLVLGAMVMLISVAGPDFARRLIAGVMPLLAQPHAIGAIAGLRDAYGVVLMIVLPVGAALLAVGAASVLLQTGLQIHLGALAPDFSRISPLRGLGRLFGVSTLVEAGKSVLKLSAVGASGWFAARGSLPLLASAGARPVGQMMAEIMQLLGMILLPMLAAQGAITAFDVARTRLKHARDLRMSREEVREESREVEGDPKIKARIRQLRQQRARRRLTTAMRTATVVITNPTHYAVALAYDRARGGAPRLVAKGMDDMAARIRAIAKDNSVPLMANPPLARALYPVDVDSEIPAEHFQAVAEIIAYVWRLKGTRR